ncbi:MAG: GNAT family N-acetyltransferase [Nanoarchaeota archaeon]|nr:GNAT family N-acetyltransferase [Nanoarchaeota archaeon]
MIIRQAKKQDLKQIAELDLVLAMEISRKDFFKKDETILKKMEKPYLYRDFKNKNNIFFVAEEKKQIIGFAGGHIKTNLKFFKIKKVGFIREIYVKPSHRHKGLGQKLMREIIRYFKNKKIKVAQLTVLTNNQPAFKLYQSLGFEENRKKMVRRI